MRLHNWEGIDQGNYSLKIGRGKVILRADKNFTFTCSFGANSNKSYTGCFFGTNINTLQESKDILYANAHNINKGDRIDYTLKGDT
jgi:hypothetical protein